MTLALIMCCVFVTVLYFELKKIIFDLKRIADMKAAEQKWLKISRKEE